MKNTKFIFALEYFFNAAEIFAVLLMLIMAFMFQIIYNELPCPLCLLQRLGFFGVACGFLLNMRYGLRPSHYSIVLLSAFFTCLVALRQIALHVVPGTGSYGDPFLGMHLYTWSFIIGMLVIAVTAFMLGMDRQYIGSAIAANKYRKISYFLYSILFLMLALNLLTVVLECGLALCPDNPTTYNFLGLWEILKSLAM